MSQQELFGQDTRYVYVTKIDGFITGVTFCSHNTGIVNINNNTINVVVAF